MVLTWLNHVAGSPKARIVDRDSGNLVNTFMRVTTHMMRHLAILRKSQLLPPGPSKCQKDEK